MSQYNKDSNQLWRSGPLEHKVEDKTRFLEVLREENKIIDKDAALKDDKNYDKMDVTPVFSKKIK